MKLFIPLLPCPLSDKEFTRKDLDELLENIWLFRTGLEAGLNIDHVELERLFVYFLESIGPYRRPTPECVKQFFTPLFPPTANSWEAFITASALIDFQHMLVDRHGERSEFFHRFETVTRCPPQEMHENRVLFVAPFEPCSPWTEGPFQDQSCSVCLQAFRRGEPVSILSCFHRLHPACLREFSSESWGCPLYPICHLSTIVNCVVCDIEAAITTLMPGVPGVDDNHECKNCGNTGTLYQQVYLLGCGHWYCKDYRGAYVRNPIHCARCYLDGLQN